MPSKIIPIVMCGGAGTRLWPVSRDTMPKQFIALLGQDSTFQRAMRLLSDASVFAPAIVGFFRAVAEHLLSEPGALRVRPRYFAGVGADRHDTYRDGGVWTNQ